MNNMVEDISAVLTKDPGESVIYHRGHLAYDRQHNRRLSKAATMAMKLADDGLISLVQRRIGECVWDYIAVRRRPA